MLSKTHGQPASPTFLGKEIYVFAYRLSKQLDLLNNYEYSICKIVEKLSLTMNIPFNKVVWDTSKSDGCLKKTVSNVKFKQYYSNFTFTSYCVSISFRLKKLIMTLKFCFNRLHFYFIIMTKV